MMGAATAFAVLCLSAAAAPPVFEGSPDALGLAGLHAGPMVPVWMDLTGDGQPEPLWLSYDGTVSLQLDEDGVEMLVDVEMPPMLVDPGGPHMVGVTLDVEGDGTVELLVIARELYVLRATEPNRLVADTLPLPTLPGAAVSDAAVGDLNADGLPDVVLALGVFSVERIDLLGLRDVVLMNLGQGRFDLHPVEPGRYGFSNGVTLADMDGDGQVDLVESMDASPMVGPSRTLLNRTPPGARAPVFEVSDVSWDVGTFGMGAAVGDLDQDGRLDLYNTSVGLDLLVMGQADGSLRDETVQRGFGHEWGLTSMRSQWSPTFVDMNADGLLDVLVRHGDQGAASAAGMSDMTVYAADLVYVQAPGGTFSRADVPFDEAHPPQGRQAVVGDLNADGLPDVALGGLGGSAAFWRNVTTLPETTRVLTLRFAPTVSPWPPTGARVEATCGGEVLTRVVTSGGKMGGAATDEIFLAWPGCTEPASVTVNWPSGATSVHQATDSVQLTAAEPRWWQVVAAGVLLDPQGTGASSACVGQAVSPWACCELGDGPCVLPLPEGGDDQPLVRLADSSPMALPVTWPGWALLTDPSPPRPGQVVKMHVIHVGGESTFSSPALSLFVDGVHQPWTEPDMERRIMTTETDVPLDATSLVVTLFPWTLPPEPTWIVETGSALDPDWTVLHVYPYRITGGITEYWNWAAFATSIRGLESFDLLEGVAVETADGAPLDGVISLIGGAVSRLRFLVDHEDLQGQDAVVVRDKAGAFFATIPLPGTLTLEEAVAVVAEARGGLGKTRLRGAGDMSPLFVTLRDGKGRVMQPEPELVTVEVDGGHVLDPPSGFAGTYNLMALVFADGGEGPGEVRMRATDGRLLGTFPFMRMAPGGADISLDDSWATLDAMPPPAGQATHVLRIYPVGPYGELVGANVQVTLEVTGGQVLVGPRLTMGGELEADLGPQVGATEIRVDVTLDGAFLVTLTAPIQSPLLADEAGGEDAPGATDAHGMDTAPLPEATPPASRGCSCDGTGKPPAGPAAILALWVLAVLVRRRA